MFPSKFREDIFFKVASMQEMADHSLSQDAQDMAIDKFRALVQRQAELIVQWSAIDGCSEQPAHVLSGDSGYQDCDAYYADAQYSDQCSQELLYGAKGWQTKGRYKGNGGYKGKGKDGGKGKGTDGNGKDYQLLCANCGTKGHTVAQCKMLSVGEAMPSVRQNRTHVF